MLVIITAAQNEEQYIQKTIDSIVSQTMRPDRWYIVDDGSIDLTRKIVEAACRKVLTTGEP